MKNHVFFNKWKKKSSLLVTLFYALMGAWLIIISTLLAFAHLATWKSSIKALAIFFLALRFFTITSFKFFKIVSTWLIFLFYWLFGFLNHSFMLLIIITPVTSTLGCTKFAWGETLAVHLQAFCLFAYTTGSFLFRCYSSFCMFGLTFLLYVQWNV
jgi:hypothetical protein